MTDWIAVLLEEQREEEPEREDLPRLRGPGVMVQEIEERPAEDELYWVEKQEVEARRYDEHRMEEHWVERPQAEMRWAEERREETRQAEARWVEARQVEERREEERQAEMRRAEERWAEERQVEAYQAEARQAEKQRTEETHAEKERDEERQKREGWAEAVRKSIDKKLRWTVEDSLTWEMGDPPTMAETRMAASEAALPDAPGYGSWAEVQEDRQNWDVGNVFEPLTPDAGSRMTMGEFSGQGAERLRRLLARGDAALGRRPLGRTAAEPERGGGSGMDAGALDRLVERDARRYDGGFQLY